MNAIRFCAVLALVILSGLGPVLEVDAVATAAKCDREVAKVIFEDVRYEAASADLSVGFPDGSVYVYHGVPVEIYQDLTRIVNRGEYFARNIRGRFAYERLPSAESKTMAKR